MFPPDEDFSRRLKGMIRLRFSSMADFSRHCGIPYRTVRDYAFAGKRPGSDALVAMSRGLGVSIDWLLLGDRSRQPRRLTTLEFELLSQIIEKTEQVAAKREWRLTPHEKAFCVATIYRLALPTRKVREEIVDQIVSNVGVSLNAAGEEEKSQ